MAKISVRNRNEGQFYKDGKRKPANWEFRFEGAKVDGKRKTISKAGFATKKDAEIAGSEALAEYNNAGSHFVPSDMSYSDFLDYWFDNYVMMNLKYRTQESYRIIIEKHLKPSLGMYRLKALNPSTIQEYINAKARDGLKRSTLSHILSAISGSLKYAVLPMKYLQSSPAQYVAIPKTAQKSDEKKLITTEDFQRIIERFPVGNPFHYALMIGFYTGLRIGEVYGLTWNDIDFENKTLSVNKIMYKRNFGVESRRVIQEKGKKEEKCGWYIGTPKTTSSTRTIKIGDTLLNELKEFRNMQLMNESMYGEYYTNQYIKKEADSKGFPIYRILSAEASLPVALPKTEFIMRKENGELQSIDSFKYADRVIHYELGIDFNFHSLRHTHATMLIESNVSPKAVQMRLGHNNIETTLQTYTHETDAIAQSAVDAFEDIVLKNLSTTEHKKSKRGQIADKNEFFIYKNA